MIRTPFAALGIAAFLAILPASAADPAPQPVPRNARCAVCGMYPAQYPQWKAQIVFNDQSAAQFDSPAELFRFLHNMPAFDRRHSAADVGAVWVSEYAGKAWVDARKAVFVAGSRARGPMNDPNLPAFSTREAADAHIRSQGGRALAYEEITRDVVHHLAGGHAH